MQFIQFDIMQHIYMFDHVYGHLFMKYNKFHF